MVNTHLQEVDGEIADVAPFQFEAEVIESSFSRDVVTHNIYDRIHG